MNNKVIIGIAVVVALVVGGYLFTRNSNNSSDVMSDNQTAAPAEQTSMQTGSIKSLIDSGQNRKCTFHTSTADYDSTGTIYAGGGKMRGDFSANVHGTASVTHMIYDGSTSYGWIEGNSSGFKMSLDANAQTANANAQAVDPNKNYGFSCESWSINNSMFELPAGVEFKSLPTAPGAPAGATTDVNAARKAVCDKLSDPDRTQCLSVIK